MATKKDYSEPIVLGVDQNEADKEAIFMDSALHACENIAEHLRLNDLPVTTEIMRDVCLMQRNVGYEEIDEAVPNLNPNAIVQKRCKEVVSWQNCDALLQALQEVEDNAVAELPPMKAKAERERVHYENSLVLEKVWEIKQRERILFGFGRLADIISVDEEGKVSTTKPIKDYAEECNKLTIKDPNSMCAYELIKDICKIADEVRSLFRCPPAGCINLGGLITFKDGHHVPMVFDYDLYFRKEYK